jgi:hypothetical protein
MSGHLSLLKRSANPLPPKGKAHLAQYSSKPQLFYFNRDPDAQTLQYAQNHGISFNFLNTEDTFLFELHRNAFRGGLGYALKMENYFAEKAADLENEEWSISDLTASFTLSVGGGFAIATVAGTESVAITFSREPVYKSRFQNYLTSTPVSTLATPSTANQPPPKNALLGTYLENKILDMQEVLAQPEPPGLENSAAYKLFIFNLTLAPGITFGYQGFLGVTLSPFISFSWLK